MKHRGVCAFIVFIVACAVISFNGCGGGNDGVALPKSWHHPESLSDNMSPDGQDASSPQVAMDDDGNIIIVWVQSDGTNNQIFKSEYRNGSWTHPASLSDNISPDGQDASDPQVAMDDNGNAIIAWAQNDGTTPRIFKSEYRNGIWTHPSDLSDNISPDTWFNGICKVAMDDNGNAIIVWSAGTYGNEKILMSEYRNGEWIHSSEKINPGDLLAGCPSVTMDNSGNAIIVWEEYDADAHPKIYKSEYRSGAWTHPMDVANYISLPGNYALFPQVAMDNIGNAVIIWVQDNGTESGLVKTEFRGGSWHGPPELSDKIGSVSVANCHKVAMDDNGNAIIVWESSDGINTQVFKSEYRNGAWKNPTDLTDNISPDGSDASFPDVAMDNNGNALITWSQYNGIVSKIFRSEYRDGAWIHPSTFFDNINPDGQDAIDAQVAMSNNGNAIIVWQQFDGTNRQIFKSEYR